METSVMFLRRPPRAAQIDKGGERRSACRYGAARSPLAIGWWNGPEFEAVAIVLRDISLSGASALTNTPPPPSVPVWLRLNEPSHPDWIEAKVIAITAQRWGPSLVRMTFREACPYEFFKAAIRGIEPPGEPETPGMSEAERRFWSSPHWK